ncbi:hypothetical protein Pelo_16853 [Pelomyxa schiedti]|nr:hypothetical protein Pelo_16853 [Pelomyxa schiedti]
MLLTMNPSRHSNNTLTTTSAFKKTGSGSSCRAASAVLGTPPSSPSPPVTFLHIVPAPFSPPVVYENAPIKNLMSTTTTAPSPTADQRVAPAQRTHAPRRAHVPSPTFEDEDFADDDVLCSGGGVRVGSGSNSVGPKHGLPHQQPNTNSPIHHSHATNSTTNNSNNVNRQQMPPAMPPAASASASATTTTTTTAYSHKPHHKHHYSGDGPSSTVTTALHPQCNSTTAMGSHSTGVAVGIGAQDLLDDDIPLSSSSGFVSALGSQSASGSSIISSNSSTTTNTTTASAKHKKAMDSSRRHRLSAKATLITPTDSNTNSTPTLSYSSDDFSLSKSEQHKHSTHSYTQDQNQDCSPPLASSYTYSYTRRSSSPPSTCSTTTTTTQSNARSGMASREGSRNSASSSRLTSANSSTITKERGRSRSRSPPKFNPNLDANSSCPSMAPPAIQELFPQTSPRQSNKVIDPAVQRVDNAKANAAVSVICRAIDSKTGSDATFAEVNAAVSHAGTAALQEKLTPVAVPTEPYKAKPGKATSPPVQIQSSAVPLQSEVTDSSNKRRLQTRMIPPIK